MNSKVNLNLFARTELLDTLKILPSGSLGGYEIAMLLNGMPYERGEGSDTDVFEVTFDRAVLESIAFGIEEYTFERAADYIVAVEEGDNKKEQDRSFQYWQELCERWSFLELMR